MSAGLQLFPETVVCMIDFLEHEAQSVINHLYYSVTIATFYTQKSHFTGREILSIVYGLFH